MHMDYARLLTINKGKGYTLVSISNPWRAHATLHRYALVPRDSAMPPSLPSGATVVRVPLTKMCVSTAVHANLFMQIGAQSNMSSLCDTRYILTKPLQQLVANGTLADMGSSMNPNVEKMIKLQTDAVLMSPFEGASYGLVEKTGIPIIECADYMETSAMGRAEWIKFYGLLVGREHEADSLYQHVKSEYLRLRQLASKATTRPKLLVDKVNAQTWYLPGGNSTYGSMYIDAKADYSVADSQTSGTQALSLETVMTTALDADVWIIKYGQTEDLTYRSLADENQAYTKFKAYHDHRIYGCNTLYVPFYDEASFRPDLLMADVLSMLHPELMPGHQLRYYTPLK